MTEPSQYFKGRTVQEQMDEVIGYVDRRAEEVAATKADAVLQPAEAAKTAAQAAAEAAEAAKDTTLAALPTIQQDITDLKAENVALDGRLNTVELKVQTAEGNIVTIQGQIVALQNVQGDYVKKDGEAQTVTSQIMVPTTATGVKDTQIANGTRIQNDLDAYAPMIRTTGSQKKNGALIIANVDYASSALYIENVGNSAHIDIKGTTTPDPDGAVHYGGFIQFSSSGNVQLCAIRPVINADNTVTVQIGVRNSNGTMKWIKVATGDVINEST